MSLTFIVSAIAAEQLTTLKVAGTLLAPFLASNAMRQARVALPMGSHHKVSREVTRERRQRMLPW